MGEENPPEVKNFEEIATQFWTPFFAVLNQ
jgi:hypothetical protein